MEDWLTSEERYLREMLRMIHNAHAQAAAPYVKRLAELYAMRSPPPLILNLPRLTEGDTPCSL